MNSPTHTSHPTNRVRPRAKARRRAPFTVQASRVLDKSWEKYSAAARFTAEAMPRAYTPSPAPRARAERRK